MGVIKALAERWADKKLIKDNADLRYQLVTAQAAAERLKQEYDKADAAVGRLEASLGTFNKAVLSLQRNLATEQEISAELLGERNEARQQVAELASENVLLVDEKRHLAAQLADAREETRQARRELALTAELVTPEAISSAMSRLEIPGQREGEASS